ncbi:hypothetical protein NXF25_012482 [Crotalus adamanteus]|uniref:Elapor1-like galactose binding domain-containing protein n=1 Tax=Crotalus adamanteus TaxID=8729 RepID=A0AAW1BBP7_CROAD
MEPLPTPHPASGASPPPQLSQPGPDSGEHLASPPVAPAHCQGLLSPSLPPSLPRRPRPPGSSAAQQLASERVASDSSPAGMAADGAGTRSRPGTRRRGAGRLQARLKQPPEQQRRPGEAPPGARGERSRGPCLPWAMIRLRDALCWLGSWALLLGCPADAVAASASLQLPPCREADYHFEYTECDSSGSRWRVAIPNPGAECSSLPDPVRGKECTFSCASGEYLEMKNQVCSKCAEGTYSLGSGIKFDEWDDLPAGFSNVATYMDSILGSAESKADSCAKSSWTPRGNYIESNRDDCTVSLIYTVHLKKSGSIFFEYQYIDNNIFFEFFIQNDQCQEMDSTSDKWVKLTDNGEWGSYSVTLKSGTNILYWRTTGILMGSQVVKPVLVKNITIEGVAYTSECFPCKPGTFSNKSGSSMCEICPRNTYSEKGARECTKCPEETHYSDEGSGQCLERLPCSNKDFFQIHTPCDWEGKVSWISSLAPDPKSSQSIAVGHT